MGTLCIFALHLICRKYLNIQTRFLILGTEKEVKVNQHLNIKTNSEGEQREIKLRIKEEKTCVCIEHEPRNGAATCLTATR